jgi:hypothetical protein
MRCRRPLTSTIPVDSSPSNSTNLYPPTHQPYYGICPTTSAPFGYHCRDLLGQLHGPIEYLEPNFTSLVRRWNRPHDRSPPGVREINKTPDQGVLAQLRSNRLHQISIIPSLLPQASPSPPRRIMPAGTPMKRGRGTCTRLYQCTPSRAMSLFSK